MESKSKPNKYRMRPPTSEEKLILALYPTMQNYELARMSGWTVAKINELAAKHNVRKVEGFKDLGYPSRKTCMMMALYPTMQNYELAEISGVDENSIRHMARRHGLKKADGFVRKNKPTEKPRTLKQIERDINAHQRKLAKTKRDSMIAELCPNYTKTQIVKTLGVSYQTVKNVVERLGLEGKPDEE